MDSLFSILNSKNFDEPPEVSAIKRYVQQEFEVEVGVQLNGNLIIVLVDSAALASSLRLKSADMKRRCQLTKRVSFRVV